MPLTLLALPYRMRLLLLPCLLSVAALALVACGDDDSAGATSCESSVDRADVLATSAGEVDERISRLTIAVGQLDMAIGELLADPRPELVERAKQTLLTARFTFADLAPYALVVDPSQQTLPSLAAFPVDTALINGYVTGAPLDPATAPDFDRGFAAVEYLLHAAPAERTADRLRDESTRSALLRAYVDDVVTRVERAGTLWADGRDAFVSTDGTAAGSGFSRLVNSLSKHYEDTRRDRLGTPFGVTLGFPSPQTLEAPYSGHSLRLLRRNIEASAMAYEDAGVRASVTLADYLAGLGTAEPTELNADIAARYAEAQTALDALPDDLATAFENDRDAVQTAYNAISRQVVNLKTDLPSVTCVSITYVDNPSDSD